MVSYAAGARVYALLGASMGSFYDWCADLPVASPQMFGDQTDVSESGDWWDATYLMLWGSNVPVTRTPDAHRMTEARLTSSGHSSLTPTPATSPHDQARLPTNSLVSTYRVFRIARRVGPTG